MKLLRRYPEVIFLLGAALLTRLWDIFTPSSVVFDEVYFKVYAGDYLTGSYYFDPHPPLGKLLLGAWAWLFHLNSTNLTNPAAASVALRVLPGIAGALIIPVFYLFLRQLRIPRRAAALGAALLLLENALLVESRFVLIDSMLILFGFSAVTCFLAARHRFGRARYLLLGLSALFAGLSASTKWTGLSALGLIMITWLFDHAHHFKKFSWRTRAFETLQLLVIPITIYMGIFALHFSLLTKTGQGDAFMPVKFQSTLVGNPNYDSSVQLSFFEKFIDLNLEMNQSETSLKDATHPYASKWISWPLMTRGVYYWQGDILVNGSQGNIYLLGNPVVWWGILIVILGGMVASGTAMTRLKRYRFGLAFLCLGYAMNFLPFSRIVRVMFLYHYFFALMYSLAVAVILLSALFDWEGSDNYFWHFNSKSSRYLYIGVLVLAFAGFVYMAPLSYGNPLSPNQLAQHMWLKTWR